MRGSRQELAQRLEEWRYGQDSTGQNNRRNGPTRTLVDLCVASFARGIVAGRLDLLLCPRTWVPAEFMEQAMRAVAEVSPQTVTDDVLEAFMQFCTCSLRELHAFGCSGVTDKSIKAACDICPSLRHIDLRRTNVTEQGIVLLGKKQKRLQSVWLSGTESVTDFSVTRLVLSLKTLSDLRLRNCFKLSDDACVPLVQKTSLQVLDLGGLCNLSEEALVRVVRTCTQLTNLNLSRCSSVGSDLVWNIGPRVAVRLEAASDEEQDGGGQEGDDKNRACDNWEELSEASEMHRTLGLPWLKALSLAKCSLVTDSGLSQLSQCSLLEELDISDCERVTDSSVMSILKACWLRALVLRGCKSLTDASLQVLGRTQSSLTTLDASHSVSFSNNGFHMVLRARSLTTLNAAYCPKLSDQGLRRLACPHTLCSSACRGVCGLVELNLTYTSVTFEALKQVAAQRTSLKLLVVAGLQLTDGQAAALSRVAHLARHPETSVVQTGSDTQCGLPAPSRPPPASSSASASEPAEREGESGLGEGGGGAAKVGRLTIITEWEKEGRILVLPSFAA